MYEQLRQNITRKVTLTSSEFEQIEAVAKPLSLRKKARLLTIGEPGNYIVFVNKGCLRSFSLNTKGVEHIVQLAFEDNWISDLYSYVSETPAVLHIESVEDCDLLLFYKADLENLYLQIPMLERWMRLLLQNAYVAVQRRLNSSLSVPAEERYAQLIHSHPDIASRVPLIHIASYLGITPESLSRIRRQLLHK